MSEQRVLLSGDVQSWSTNLFIETATTVWLFHEFLLTLPRERQCIWRRRFSAVTAVFFVTRYLTLLKQALKVAQFVPWDDILHYGDTACNVLLRVDAVLNACLYASVSVFSAVRMYAISWRNVKLAALVFGLGMVNVSSSMYINNVGGFAPLPDPLSGCVQIGVTPEERSIMTSLGENQPLTMTYQVAAYLGTGSVILSELIVQVYTWYRTLGIQRDLKKYNIKSSLFWLLMRDGAISYLILTAWYIVTRLVTRIKLAIMALPGVSVLLCRFIISLRQVTLPENNSSSTARMSRMVGNAGAPLRVNMGGASKRGSKHAEDEGNENAEEDDGVWITDDPLMAGLHPEDDGKVVQKDTSTGV